MPIFVCNIAVINPDTIPAPIAAAIERYGCPAIATTAPTVAPNKISYQSIETAVGGKVADIEH